MIDDDIGARALIFRLAPIDLEPALSQAGQRGAGGMGKPAHCVGKLVDCRAALSSQKANGSASFEPSRGAAITVGGATLPAPPS